jgi:hypothetical protein
VSKGPGTAAAADGRGKTCLMRGRGLILLLLQGERGTVGTVWTYTAGAWKSGGKIFRWFDELKSSNKLQLD